MDCFFIMETTKTDNPAWKRYGNLLIDLAGFALLFVALSALLSAPLQFFPGTQSMVNGDSPVGLLAESMMLAAALAAAWGVLRWRRAPFSRLGLAVKGHSAGWLWAAALIAGLYSAGFGVLWLAGAVQVEGIAFPAGSLLLSLLFFLFVALFEEVVFRGFALGRMLDSGMNGHVALAVSALLFSVVHWGNPSFSFLPFFNIFLAGLFLGASYMLTRNLCLPVALHLFWNWVQGPVLGFNVSGMGLGGQVLQIRVSGAPLLSGGGFGFEGSLMCTVVLAAGTAIILFAAKKRRAQRG